MSAPEEISAQRESPAVAPPRVRSLRRLLLISGGVYLAWWFVVDAALPGAYNALPGRLAVVGAFVAAFAASFVSRAVERHLQLVFIGCAWLLTAHYYYLFHRNGGDMAWAMGAYVVVFAVAACLPTRSSLLLFSLETLLLGGLVALLHRALLHTIFLPGLLTTTLLSNLTLHNRFLLEHERAERVRVETARAVAVAGVALRDEFIAVASQGLRTPLTALQLSVQGLLRVVQGAETPPSAQLLTSSLKTCQRQTTRLARLVDNLLDASRISSGEFALRVENILLVELVRDVARRLAADAERAGSAIAIAGDADICGLWDRRRLEQVVSNLLRNAIGFGLGRPIHVTVSAAGSRARLSVADEGIGVAPEQQERIFGPFERAVSSRNYAGMGLGLFVVRRIVEAHGGSVHVESKPGSGAAFIVELPRAA